MRGKFLKQKTGGPLLGSGFRVSGLGFRFFWGLGLAEVIGFLREGVQGGV